MIETIYGVLAIIAGVLMLAAILTSILFMMLYRTPFWWQNQEPEVKEYHEVSCDIDEIVKEMSK